MWDYKIDPELKALEREYSAIAGNEGLSPDEKEALLEQIKGCFVFLSLGTRGKKIASDRGLGEEPAVIILDTEEALIYAIQDILASEIERAKVEMNLQPGYGRPKNSHAKEYFNAEAPSLAYQLIQAYHQKMRAVGSTPQDIQKKIRQCLYPLVSGLDFNSMKEPYNSMIENASTIFLPPVKPSSSLAVGAVGFATVRNAKLISAGVEVVKDAQAQEQKERERSAEDATPEARLNEPLPAVKSIIDSIHVMLRDHVHAFYEELHKTLAEELELEDPFEPMQMHITDETEKELAQITAQALDDFKKKKAPDREMTAAEIDAVYMKVESALQQWQARVALKDVIGDALKAHAHEKKLNKIAEGSRTDAQEILGGGNVPTVQTTVLARQPYKPK